MNVFDPRTFSTDWEIFVVDRLNRVAATEKVLGFAETLEAELQLPIKVDWNALECPLGVNTSLAQIWQRIQLVTDRAGQLLREYDLDLFPGGAHPTEMIFNASHIHVGTIRDETAGIHLENQLLPYMPVFAALAANSPATHGQRGAFKSYRVRHQARGCTRPSTVRDPALSQFTWGTDGGPKVYGAPTLEVRIIDSASSRRFLAELMVFVAAFVHKLGTQVDETRPTADAYRDFLINRWSAARDGMQATFRWGGQTRPVAEILDDMLDACAAEMQVLGATRADLGLINIMVAKRRCQADYLLTLQDRFPDPYCLASVAGKLLRNWDIIDAYLHSASACDPVPAPDEQAILEAHAEVIGEGTHFYRSREVMYFPPPMADAVIEDMVQQGLVRREVTSDRGTLLYRGSSR